MFESKGKMKRKVKSFIILLVSMSLSFVACLLILGFGENKNTNVDKHNPTQILYIPVFYIFSINCAVIVSFFYIFFIIQHHKILLSFISFFVRENKKTAKGHFPFTVYNLFLFSLPRRFISLYFL